jgi:hypothetical protein
MGVHANITATKFPAQGSELNKRVKVYFHYDATVSFDAVCVRDDVESPFLTIFRLDDGRHVLATECQYS